MTFFLGKNAIEITSSIRELNKPKTAEKAAGNSASRIPKKAGNIISQKINHKIVKTTPFRRVKIPLRLCCSSSGSEPSFSRRRATTGILNPHREQNFTSTEICFWPHLGQCIKLHIYEAFCQLQTNNEFCHEKFRFAKTRIVAAFYPSAIGMLQMRVPDNVMHGRLYL